MWRFLAGAAASFLLLTGAFLFWQSRAAEGPKFPAAPSASGISSLFTGSGQPLEAPEASAKTREEKRFSRYDKNKDGKVEADEYLAARKRNFDKLDRRRNMSLPEAMLWQALRQRPDGFKFRRQHPIGRCIVDFYCPATKLVIEVDGEAHRMGDEAERDRRRDAWLTGQGLRVLRFAATDVMQDVNSVLTAITAACRR